MKPEAVPREAVSAFCQAFWGAYPGEGDPPNDEFKTGLRRLKGDPDA